MSEFQSYQFKAIDKALTNAERKEVSSWSSRTEATSRSAIFTYSYGDFPKNEEKVLAQYFDAFLYMSNWGTRRLMFKFPLSVIDIEKLEVYDTTGEEYYGESDLKMYLKSGFFIIEMYHSPDDGDDGWLEDDPRLDNLVGLRWDILTGDYRSLFIFWLYILKIRSEDEDVDEAASIPKSMIPPKLDQLTSELDALIEFFDIDDSWITAAARFHTPKENKTVNYPKQLKLLSRAKKEAYLLKLLNGESNLELKLKKELTQLSKSGQTIEEEERVLLVDLLEKVDEVDDERAAVVQQERQQEYLKKMKDLAENKSMLWSEVIAKILKGTGNSYRDAIKIILDLQTLAKHESQESEFDEKMEEIIDLSKRKPAMMRRLRENNLLF